MPALMLVITASISTLKPGDGRLKPDDVLQVDRQKDVEADHRRPAERVGGDGEARLLVAEDGQRNERLGRRAQPDDEGDAEHDSGGQQRDDRQRTHG